MNVFKEDLLKNRYFIGVAVIVVVASALIWFISYNSPEAKCQRKLQQFAPLLGEGRGNKTHDFLVNTVIEQEIKKCIKQNGKL